ncbi:uncharacterized protein EDB91DRAFT_1079387 [Suillus paluster]|uniref:uncharacterized protein n=1 Tax=Suillus paluster TaxID=48578 RepID=UPI001B86C5BB|nr:uncharacterized protein EDB91DRAFT_1079387 [Suillus paluster]KAG1748427.1 hypothetical protein EDB91DRAFT_1079387 [Suillus paluster]
MARGKSWLWGHFHQGTAKVDKVRAKELKNANQLAVAHGILQAIRSSMILTQEVVSAITAVELPISQWLDLIEILLGFINMFDDTNLKITTLQAISYICETIVH